MIVVAFPAALIFPWFLPFILSAGVLALPTFYHRLFKHGVALLLLALITSGIVVGIWRKDIEAVMKSRDALKRDGGAEKQNGAQADLLKEGEVAL